MKWGVRHLMLLVLGLLILSACKPGVPSEVIQPDDMEDILYDYYVAQGMAVKEGEGTDYYRNLYFEAVLKKHGVTKAEFDSSLVYYYTRADRFVEVFKNVEDRLGKEAIERGASVSEVARYSSQSLSGDTADIWDGRRMALLMPQRPHHLLQFYQEADTSYHAGDSFLLTLDCKFLAQERNIPTVVYLAITYQNDSTYCQNTTVSSYSETTLRIPVCRERVKNIRGYIMMGQRMSETTTDMCLLFLNRIQLIRFHNEVPEEKPALFSDSLNAQRPDSLKADSARLPRRLGERPGPSSEPARPKLQLNKPITR